MDIREHENISSIRIVPYDKKWEKEFLLLSEVLKNTLRDLVLSIEHVGSTSVKGLGAKPIIDLDIVINDELIFREISDKLHRIGYIHEGNKGIEGREAFARKNDSVPWIDDKSCWIEHHLYVCTKDNKELLRHLKFRNYLREHPEVAKEYEQLKIFLAKNSKSRLEYTEEKSDFINQILDLTK